MTHNARIGVVHEDMRTWRLRIKQLRESDRGCYMCQINASPMKKQTGCIDVQGKYYFIDTIDQWPMNIKQHLKKYYPYSLQTKIVLKCE